MENVAEIVRGLVAGVVPKSFVGDFASLDAEGVSIKLDAGEETVSHFGGATTHIYRPFVTLTIRSSSYATAGSWLASIRAVLEGYNDGSVGLFSLAPPAYLGRDDLKMHEFQVTYKALIKE